MHGAAVLIDVPTGEVRALVSYPTFDLNELDERYGELVHDELSMPLMNRATQSQLFPGSTVKPIVGMAAITEGLIGVNDGIECTGYLVINGKPIRPGFRCWTASKFEHLPPELRPPPGHHQVPYQDPHVGHHGNPDGSLTYVDAIQRSCNVYFETLGDRLRIEGLSRWYYKFGLGRPTGLGIAEVRGRLPISHMKPVNRPQVAWHSAIGQVQVTATPIQMANVAATIARGGTWMRPRLLKDDEHLAALQPAATTAPVSEFEGGADRIDLHIKPEALAAAREGMIRVINTEGGTGKPLRRSDMVVAGKTGTATASPLRVKVRDASGKETLEPLRPATAADPNPDAPWYRGGGSDGKTLNHAWFIGFAPADNPKVAFAVLVEWGLSGGATAGTVANGLLDACVERGYLKKSVVRSQ
jgi:penicillin-binding protein 2